MLLDKTAAPGWFDWITMSLAVAAFIFAVWQLKDTRDANKKSTAALVKSTTALDRARIKLNWDQLSAILPQIVSISSDLDFAMDNNNGAVAQRALVRYGHLATETETLVGSLQVDDHEVLASRLNASSNTAFNIKASLAAKPTTNVLVVVKKIANDIQIISRDINGIVASNRNQLGEHGHV